MFALLWVFLIMPSRRRAQAQRQLIASVEVGDEILTVGGIYGRVLEDRGEDELLVEIAPDMQVRVARRAVAAVLPPEEEPEQLEPSVFEQNEQVRS
jgi:preprotein translocase subunit YajC